MSIWKTQRASLLVVLTAMLLLVLAVLQYRWVGELSEFEYQRRQRTLQASTQGLARDIDREFRRIRAAVEIRRFRETKSDLGQEFEEWSNSTDFPELVSDVYWVDSQGDDATLQQLNVESGQLEDLEWSPLLDPLRDSFNDRVRESDRNRIRLLRSGIEKLGQGTFALIVPQDERSFRAWAVLLLDRTVLEEDFIPAMVERYFGSDGERDYDIWISEDADNGQVFYSSNVMTPVPGEDEADFRQEVSGIDWIIAARHQTGSLEAFIGQHRMRNLTLGVGIVLVLGASFVFLVVATRRAQWLAERQMEFVAGVSHELRTPIAGISSLSQNLADGVVRNPTHVEQYGRSINNESHRLRDMVEKVLHFSSVRSGRHRYTFGPVDMRLLLEKEIDTLERYTEGSRVPSLSVEDDLPPVQGDELALRSLVRNLVSNAIKFGGDGPVAVSARCVEERDRKVIELSVSDRGEGVAPAEVAHIFDPFFRGKAARDRQVSGTGLGLSLVREIVNAHHGRTEVSTEPGQGATFRVYLPAQPSGENHESGI